MYVSGEKIRSFTIFIFLYIERRVLMFYNK